MSMNANVPPLQFGVIPVVTVLDFPTMQVLRRAFFSRFTFQLLVGIGSVVCEALCCVFEEEAARTGLIGYYAVAFGMVTISFLLAIADFLLRGHAERARWTRTGFRYPAHGDDHHVPGRYYGSLIQFLGLIVGLASVILSLTDLILRLTKRKTPLHFSIYPLIFATCEALHIFLMMFGNGGRFYTECQHRGDVRVIGEHDRGVLFFPCVLCSRRVCPPRVGNEALPVWLFPDREQSALASSS